MALNKQFVFHKECRDKLFNGIQIMFDAVSATLGPHGRSVLIERAYNLTETTKDGVTVADEVYPEGKWENMGAQLIREAAQRSNNEAGDSTTTAIVLAFNMVKEGLAEVEKRANVYQISKGMKIACDEAVKMLASLAVMITTEEEYAKVATIATQDEDIGKIIAKTFINAGENGCIDLERSDIPGIVAEKTEGISFDKGWDSKGIFQYFLTDLKNKRCIAEDCPILVVEDKIENETQLVPLMEKLAQTQLQKHETIEDRIGWPLGTRKLVVISDTFSGTALGLMAANNAFNQQIKGRPFHLVFIEAPSYGRHKVEIMQDIAAVTGATFISKEGGKRVEYADLGDLGRAKKVVIEPKKTIIVSEMNKGDWGDAVKHRIDERITLLRSELSDMPSDHVDKHELEKRMATLTDGVSVLKIGAESESERNELRRRVEDGVRSVRSAREEGVTPGCGVGLLSCIASIDALIASSDINDQKRGMEIVKKALKSVSLRLLEVAYIEDFKGDLSLSPEEFRNGLVEEMMKSGKGYDFNSDMLVDMMNAGIYDAKKAIRVALQSATSCAMTFLKIDAAIGNMDDSEELLQKLGQKVASQIRG